MNSLFLIAALQGPGTIVVTGSREPIGEAQAPVSSSSIEEEVLDALAFPLAADALRLVPGLSVSVSGPGGSQTQVRIRGAEANHSLLFVDGIRFNDPAAGNEARFELLSTDLASRIEVVRGPQSALWGSEALSGVISVETADPLVREGFGAIAEYGGNDSARAAAQASVRGDEVGFAAAASWLRSDGIDSFGDGGGERDGFDNRSVALRAAWRPATGTQIGASALYVGGESEYDGFDPSTFRRGDTLDETHNRIAASRLWASHAWDGWTLSADASLLDSANRNRLGAAPLNRTSGRRVTAGGQVSRRAGAHRLTAAVHHEREEFSARDQLHFGATDQDRRRRLTAAVAEWHAAWSDAVTTDIAVRHDSFSAYRDTTTLRAALLVSPVRRWTLFASYGEGVAQPTFYDLYGFFPGSFVGNPGLRPESARGWELGARWRGGGAGLMATVFRNRLEHEIVDVFDPVTFLGSTRNVVGRSGRRGVELSGDYRLSTRLRLHINYTWLDADERREPEGAAIREVRRPRHSANAVAFGDAGRLGWSASLAYVGARDDVDPDRFERVRLPEYVLGSLRLGWRLTESLEAFGRIENALGADYRDVAGYNTPGRTVHAGLRLRFGD